jgi:putative Holliday junction resolvase
VLVIGVPRHADDSANAMTEAALALQPPVARALPSAGGHYRRAAVLLGSRAAAYFETDPQAAAAADQALDAQAAAVILESWFNQQRSP